MWGILGLIGIGMGIAEQLQPTLPANARANEKLFQEDMDKVRFGQMTQAELNRNMRRGKYQAPLPDYKSEADATIERLCRQSKGYARNFNDPVAVRICHEVWHQKHSSEMKEGEFGFIPYEG